MATISQIEDKLIETVKALNIFKRVLSLGRKDLPTTTVYPAAYVFFVSERDTGVKPRPVVELTFDVAAVVKNLRSEKEAARDAYTVIDEVRDSVNGKVLGFTDIEPFTCVSREIIDYGSGVIAYALRFRTRQYLPVPVE